MSETSLDDLDRRLEEMVEAARRKVKAFQAESEAHRQEVAERFQRFLAIAERIVVIAREKLERLRERLEFDVHPTRMQDERSYSRAVTLDVKTEMAGVVRLGFRLTHDSEVRLILLDYNLEIVPVFFRFNPHARLELPLEEYDEAIVARWLDNRIVEFAEAFLEMMNTKQYQDRTLVTDTVAGISFPKHFAAARLDHEGRTYYFISEESRQEFASRHGLSG